MDPVVQMQDISKQKPAQQVQLTPEQQEASAAATMYALTGYDLNAETQAPLLQAADAIRIGKMMLDNEFWKQDVAGNAEVSAKNFAAMVAGLPSDIASMATSLLASGGSLEQMETMHSPYQPSNPTWVDVPGNSTQIAEAIGGDVNHPSFLVNSLVAQGPVGTFKTLAGLAKGGIVGMINVGRRAGPTLGRYSDFLAKGKVSKYDQPAFLETGWYYGADGNPRFHLSSETAKLKDLTTNKKMARLIERAQTENVIVTNKSKPFYLEEVLDYPELFEIYPELRKMKIELAVEAHGNGIAIVDRNNLRNRGGMRMSSDDIVESLWVSNADSPNDFMETLLHEVQHVIQQVEGYAVGGNSKFIPEVWEQFGRQSGMEDVYKLIDEGIETPDDLYWELVGKGALEGDAAKLVNDPLAQSYMAADEAYRAEMWSDLDLTQGLFYDEIGYVLEYLFSKKDSVPRGVQLLTELEQKLPFADMLELHHRAYLNLYGEAEARLAGATARMSQDRINQSGPMNPAKMAPDRTQDERLTKELSVREGKPSQVVQYDPNAEIYTDLQSWIDTLSTKPQGKETIDELGNMLKALNKGGEEGTGVSTAELLRAFEEVQGKGRTVENTRILAEFPDITPERLAQNKPAAAAMADGINDVYMNSVAHGTVMGKTRLEVLKNPSAAQLKRWASKYFKGREGQYTDGPLVRLITDVEGNHYIWPADDALHDDFVKTTGIVPHWGDDWTDVDGIDPMELVQWKETGITISELDNFK